MRIGLTAVTLAAVACGSHAKPSTTPTPATQPPVGQPAVQPPVYRGNDGSIRLGPSALRYVMHSVVHIDQEFQGMHQPLDFGLRAYFAVTITGPADSVGYPTTITIDSVAADSGTTVPMGINLGNAKGLSFVGRLTPKGDFRNQSPSDSAAAQSHAAAWDDRNGSRALRVDVTSDFTIQGTGQQMGQPFDVAGTGVRSGTDFISVDGRYMGGESRDSTNMTITLTVQQMTIPRTQVSKTTVTVLP